MAKVDRNRHKVLQSVHPSPLSAHKGFFECGHFKKANEWLEQRYTVDGVIDWNLSGKVTPISKGPVSKPTEDVQKEDVSPVNGAAAASANGKEEGVTSSRGNAKLNADDDGGVDDDDAIDALNEIAAHADEEKESATAAAAEIQNGQNGSGAEKQAEELPVVAAEDIDSNTTSQQTDADGKQEEK